MRKAFIIVGPAILLLLWIILTYFNIIKPIFLPSPFSVFLKLSSLILTGSVLTDLLPTIYRWLVGLALGAAIGIPLGLIMGYSDRIYSMLEVPVDFFRSVPVMTLFPLFLVFFGLGDKSKIVAAAWAASLFILINTLYGVRHSKKLRIMVARTLKASRIQTFTKIIFPSALPEIFVGIRVAVSLSLVVVVASEMIMGTKYGIGRKIFDSALVYEMEEMYAFILIAGLLGYFSNKLSFLFETKFIHWEGK